MWAPCHNTLQFFTIWERHSLFEIRHVCQLEQLAESTLTRLQTSTLWRAHTMNTAPREGCVQHVHTGQTQKQSFSARYESNSTKQSKWKTLSDPIKKREKKNVLLVIKRLPIIYLLRLCWQRSNITDRDFGLSPAQTTVSVDTTPVSGALVDSTEFAVTVKDTKEQANVWRAKTYCLSLCAQTTLAY